MPNASSIIPSYAIFHLKSKSRSIHQSFRGLLSATTQQQTLSSSFPSFPAATSSPLSLLSLATVVLVLCG